MDIHGFRPALVLWVLTACALLGLAAWDWLPIAFCGPWLLAVIWALHRNRDDDSPVPPSYAAATRRRFGSR